MQNLMQLDPPLPVFIEGKGKGMAHIMIDYGIEHFVHFVVFMDDNGDCWCLDNRFVKIQFNQSLQRVAKE